MVHDGIRAQLTAAVGHAGEMSPFVLDGLLGAALIEINRLDSKLKELAEELAVCGVGASGQRLPKAPGQGGKQS
jgi:hypothetical protein